MKLFYLPALLSVFYLTTLAQNNSVDKNKSLHVYASGGMSVFKPVASGYRPFGFAKFSTTYSTIGTVGIEMHNNNKQFKNFIIGLSVSYNPFTFKGTATDIYVGGNFNYIAEGYIISNNLSLLYQFYKKRTFNLYAATGVGLNFIHYSRNQTEQFYRDFVFIHPADIDLLKVWSSQQLKLGILYKKKIALEAFGTNGRISKDAHYKFNLYSWGGNLKYYLF